MFLGVEIGGTKLQIGVGDQRGLVDLERRTVDRAAGAEGILTQIQAGALPLVRKHKIKLAGIGFGGPVNAARGVVIKSHQVAGWDDLPLVEWCQQQLGISAVLGNDCDVAALAEARAGAGQGKQSVFYLTVGTGIGGGFALDGDLLGAQRPAIAEIGHLRPGLQAVGPESTVESCASGPGIATQVTRALETSDDALSVRDLLDRCDGDPQQLRGEAIAEAAREGNRIAQLALSSACRTLGWAIAQVITLLAPEVVVIGGGVSLIGEERFFQPVRNAVAEYVFPPLRDSYEIVPAAFGETAVVEGALQLAAQTTR